LESVYRGNSIEGSNPSLSATCLYLALPFEVCIASQSEYLEQNAG
jgi:hypothetical protein